MRRCLLVSFPLLLSILLPTSPLVAQPKKYALLVAINNYEGTGLRSLSHTVRDMEGLKAELEKSGFEVVLLTNQGARKKQIEEALDTLVKNRDFGDMLLTAFSGHGIQTTNDKGKEDAYFCPRDADKTDVNTMLSLTSLLAKMGTRGVNLVLVDACRDDPGKGVRGIQGDELEGKLPKNTAVLFSCSAGQQSFETTQMFGEKSTTGHGIFFYLVLEGLRGKAKDADNEVTWESLVSHVKKNTNLRAKEWFSDMAKQKAKDSGVPLKDYKLQTPHALSNLQDNVVLAHGVRGSGGGSGSIGEATIKPEDKLEVDLGGGVKMKFVLIPAKDKKFWMGSPKAELDRNVGEEQHEVEFSSDFYMGMFEVKQKEYRAMMNKNPSWFCKDGIAAVAVKGLNTDDFPVESVSWQDAQDFLKILNVKSEKEKLGLKFRLPTEAEWEYSCRGGVKSKDSKSFYLKDGPTDSLFNNLINFNSEKPYNSDKTAKSLGRTAECGSFKQDTNAFGLSDLHGNVGEWCEDYYDPNFYARSPTRDPLNDVENHTHKNFRVFRGGSWDYFGISCRAAVRNRDHAGNANSRTGFRVVCVRSR